MSDTGDGVAGAAEGDRVGDIRRAKRPFVMTPEKWKELYRPVMTPEMMESFTRYWFNKGKEGGSPPTESIVAASAPNFAASYSASTLKQIVENAPALAQSILGALRGANGGNQQPNGGN